MIRLLALDSEHIVAEQVAPIYTASTASTASTVSCTPSRTVLQKLKTDTHVESLQMRGIVEAHTGNAMLRKIHGCRYVPMSTTGTSLGLELAR